MQADSGRPVALFVWGASRLGGSERRFFRLFNFMHQHGNDVHLITSKQGAEACQALGIGLDGREVHVLAANDSPKPLLFRHWAVIKCVFALIRLIRRMKFRHVHFGQNPGALTFLYALLARTACPFSISVVDPVKDYQRNRRERFYMRVTARFSSKVDCLSSQIRSDLSMFLGYRHTHKLLVAPCSFTERPSTVAPAARDIDISLIARMVPWKGHALLRDALIALADSGERGLVVHVCGSGPLELQFRREFAGIEGQQVHVHYQSDPFAILARTKVYVSLQDVENYPSQSLLEAMTCACAIVATDVGLTRLLLDESCAVLISRSPTALKDALQRLLESDSLRTRLGQQARSIVNSNHTIERFAHYLTGELFGIQS